MDNSIKSIMVDFGLPAMIIVACLVLLLTGVNGEVKAVFTLAAGWIFKSGYSKRPQAEK